jgi:uncharacterized protein involved in tellurium resistance
MTTERIKEIKKEQTQNLKKKKTIEKIRIHINKTRG